MNQQGKVDYRKVKLQKREFVERGAEKRGFVNNGKLSTRLLTMINIDVNRTLLISIHDGIHIFIVPLQMENIKIL